MQRLLTVNDIKEIFSCGKNQAYALMKSEEFPSITVGKRIYVTEEDLKDWLCSYRHKEFTIQ